MNTNYTKFFKFSNGLKSPATSLYKGYFNDYSFIMVFDDAYWFDVELNNYNRLHNQVFIPQIEKIDTENLVIQFRYKPTNLNHLFFYDQQPYTWLNDVKTLKRKLEDNNFFKINFYPHTFFYEDCQLKIFDLYGCCYKDDKIHKKTIENIIKDKNRFVFQNDYLHIQDTYNYTIRENCGGWPREII